MGQTHEHEAAGAWVRKNAVKALIVGGCVLSIGVGAALAYFTAQDSVTNEFTLAEALEISVEEPNWDAAQGQAIVPGQTMDKDPKLVNESSVDAYGIMRVSVPHKTVDVISEDGSISRAQSVDLFEYQLANPSDWTLDSTRMSEDGAYTVYTYLYNSILGGNQSTSTLFNEVTLINLAEAQSITNLDILVEGFAIQAQGFTNANDAWDAYQAQNA